MKFRPLFNPTQMQFQLTIGDWEATKGIQKISGFSRGLKFHKVDYFPYWHISNSIVLGYNRSSQSSYVKLWMYGYTNGKHFQEALGMFDVGTKVDVSEYWDTKRGMASIDIYNKLGVFASMSTPITTKTLPVGFQLFPFAEIDGTNKKKPFDVEITNIKIR